MDKNIMKQFEEAEKSEGYFITITALNDGRLNHYQQQKRFPKEDLLPSLEEIKKLIIREMN